MKATRADKGANTWHPGDEDDGPAHVAACLRDIGLGHYVSLLLYHGFDEMETLLCIEDMDMKDLGMAPQHIIRLRRRLTEIQKMHDEEVDEDTDENNAAAVFLREAGMKQYTNLLLLNGFDDMETLLDIEDSDLKDLGIPRGFALKLKRKLREFQAHQFAQESQHLHWGVTQLHSDASGMLLVPQHTVATPIPALAARSMPTQQMKSAVQLTWEQLETLGTCAIGELLLRRFFELAPEAVRLFPAHVRARYQEWTAGEVNSDSSVYDSPALRKLFSKFIKTVGCAVAGLREPSTMIPMLLQLGARHTNYGVHVSYWEVLGRALDITLQDVLQKEYTEEVRTAWAMAYRFISSVMIEGLRKASASADTQTVRESKATDSMARTLSQASTTSGRTYSEEGESTQANDSPIHLASMQSQEMQLPEPKKMEKGPWYSLCSFV